jgi:hypothetical protein
MNVLRVVTHWQKLKNTPIKYGAANSRPWAVATVNSPASSEGRTGSLLLGWLLLPVPVSNQPQTHHLSIDMTKYAFNPARVEVRQGDELVIDLTASDVVHGFYLDGFGIEQRVEPGIPRQVSLPGTVSSIMPMVERSPTPVYALNRLF